METNVWQLLCVHCTHIINIIHHNIRPRTGGMLRRIKYSVESEIFTLADTFHGRSPCESQRCRTESVIFTLVQNDDAVMIPRGVGGRSYTYDRYKVTSVHGGVVLYSRARTYYIYTRTLRKSSHPDRI